HAAHRVQSRRHPARMRGDQSAAPPRTTAQAFLFRWTAALARLHRLVGRVRCQTPQWSSGLSRHAAALPPFHTRAVGEPRAWSRPEETLDPKRPADRTLMPFALHSRSWWAP